MISRAYGKKAFVFWQEPKSGDVPVGEPAVLIHVYEDMLCLEQSGKAILITRECVPELMTALRLAIKE